MNLDDEPALQVLREIRDGITETNVRIGRVEERVGGVETAVVAVEERVRGVETAVVAVEKRVGGVERRQSESEIRLATELIAVATAVGEVRDLLREHLEERRRIDELERRVSALESRPH